MAVVRRQLLPALVAFVVLTVLTGIVYPLVVTGIAQLAFPSRADGSLLARNGVVVGSSLIGQQFEGPRWFHPRPSSAGDGYDAMSSSASNLGPTNTTLLRDVRSRAAAYRRENGLPPNTPVPPDAVTGSGSGLDPAISVANARLQAARVAGARGLSEAAVLALVSAHTGGRSLGFLGEPGVNVVELNLALDGIGR
jgi:potassium-transporting ATPase KdpC subunit